MNKKIIAAIIGGLSILGMTSQASAAPVFTASPGVLGGTGTFQATLINGFSSELLHVNSALPEQYTVNSGWINFNGFSNSGAAVLPGVSSLGNTYQLYATFDFTAHLTGGPLTGAGSNQTVDTLNFTLWANQFAGAGPNSGTIAQFTSANALTNTEATVTQGSKDIKVGTGSLISGVAGFDSLGGAFFNSITTYANTAFGNTFFTNPVPFYDLAFQTFNNTTQGIIQTGTCTSPTANCQISINQAVGGVDFNKNVPEPLTLSLLGIGLLGMGASRRLRKA
jgi:hypothetical protein